MTAAMAALSRVSRLGRRGGSVRPLLDAGYWNSRRVVMNKEPKHNGGRDPKSIVVETRDGLVNAIQGVGDVAGAGGDVVAGLTGGTRRGANTGGAETRSVGAGAGTGGGDGGAQAG